MAPGKSFFEAQDVVHFRAAPAINRLVVIANAADILQFALWPLRQQTQPHILRRVGVLILIDEDIAETLVVFLQYIRVLSEHIDRMQQKVAEVAGIERLQAGLIGGIEFAALAVGEGAGIALGNLGRAETLVLPGIDHPRELLGRPALVVDALGLDQLLDQPHDIVGVENGEAGGEAHQFE